NDSDLARAVADGRLGILETLDRRGRRERVAVPFVERPDGRLIVAAQAADAPWALALRRDPRCRHETRGTIVDHVARELSGLDRDAAAAALATAYGPLPLPSSAPVFELLPVVLDDR
ncbi:MAG TPA: hypothetical protein VIV06_01730, partial [Candidatus Limnocylindrales bacterium]